MYFVLTVVFSIITILLTTRIFKSKKRKSFKSASYDGLSPVDNGICSSSSDKLFEQFKPGQTWFFIGFDQRNSIQLTLKSKSKGCFFLIKLELFGNSYESCGYLEREADENLR